MRKLKNVIAAAMAAVSISSVAVTASAYSDYKFSFNLKSTTGDWASPVAGREKEDNENFARLHADGGYFNNSAYIEVTLYKAQSTYSSNRISGSGRLTSPIQTLDVYYNVTRGAGSKSYLYGVTGVEKAEVSGTWNP